MNAVMPAFERMVGPFDVVGPVKIRPADLYVTKGHLQPGIVLIGDAFATSCPAAGTGTNKVFTDVERLCNVHIPRWLVTRGMGVEKIADFYDDPVKRICDAHSAAKAFHLRSLSIDDAPLWQAHRWARFGAGMLRQAGRLLTARPAAMAGAGGGTPARADRVDSPPLIPAQAAVQNYASNSPPIAAGPGFHRDERTTGGNAI
jgi:2-polyprenyl-6-methoxyphenol hydroxylase-like FAD-dependent oxidoreductase